MTFTGPKLEDAETLRVCLEIYEGSTMESGFPTLFLQPQLHHARDRAYLSCLKLRIKRQGNRAANRAPQLLFSGMPCAPLTILRGKP